MSKHLDRLEALLAKALPMPDCIDVVCRKCPPPPLPALAVPGYQPKHLARYDPAGDTSANGLYAYRCDGCGGRFTLGGKRSTNP